MNTAGEYCVVFYDEKDDVRGVFTLGDLPEAKQFGNDAMKGKCKNIFGAFIPASFSIDLRVYDSLEAMN